MINSNSIIIYQTLHGYSRGHKLLAFSPSISLGDTRDEINVHNNSTSIVLSSTTQNLLRKMSDLSGYYLESTFDGYLTGYPLDSINSYALAKTWFAREIERDGAVWTHTLLIPITGLIKIKKLAILNQWFKRPQSIKDFDEYKTDIFAPLEYAGQTAKNYSIEQVEKIIAPLYTSEKPIILSSHTSTQYENLIFAIWNQQFPMMQKSFAFSTGSFRNRKLNNKTFHLQIIPHELKRQFKQYEPCASFIDLNSISNDKNPESHDPESWVKALANVIIDTSEKTSSLRNILWSQAKNKRSVKQLIDAYYFAESVKDESNDILNELLELIKKNTTDHDHDHDPDLVTELFMQTITFLKGESKRSIGDFEILRFFMTTQSQKYFNPHILTIRKRSKSLFKQNSVPFQKVVQDIQIQNENFNPVISEIILGITDALLEDIKDNRSLVYHSILNNNTFLEKIIEYSNRLNIDDSTLIELIKGYDDVYHKQYKDNVLIQHVINLLNKMFPEEKDGSKVKQKLLGAKQQRQIFYHIPEEIFINELVISSYQKIFNFKELKLGERTENFWNSKSKNRYLIFNTLFKSYVSNTPNEWAELLIGIILNTITEDDLIEGLETQKLDRQEFVFVLKKRKDFAKSGDFWNQLSTNIRTELLFHYDEKPETFELTEEVIDNIIRVGKHTKINMLIKAMGRDIFIEHLMDYDDQTIIQWFSHIPEPSNNEIITLLNSISPRSKCVTKISPSKWLEFAQRDYNENEKNFVMPFMLILGFENHLNNVKEKSHFSEELVKTSFQTVYDALKKKKLDDKYWDILKDNYINCPEYLYETEYSVIRKLNNPTDKEHLCCALINAFIRNHWKHIFFYLSINESFIFRAIINKATAKRITKHMVFLKKMYEAIKDDNEYKNDKLAKKDYLSKFYEKFYPIKTKKTEGSKNVQISA